LTCVIWDCECFSQRTSPVYLSRHGRSSSHYSVDFAGFSQPSCPWWCRCSFSPSKMDVAVSSHHYVDAKSDWLFLTPLQRPHLTPQALFPSHPRGITGPSNQGRPCCAAAALEPAPRRTNAPKASRKKKSADNTAGGCPKESSILLKVPSLEGSSEYACSSPCPPVCTYTCTCFVYVM
jgi:hypothetical protein